MEKDKINKIFLKCLLKPFKSHYVCHFVSNIAFLLGLEFSTGSCLKPILICIFITLILFPFIT